jgi:hypothetical protein
MAPNLLPVNISANQLKGKPKKVGKHDGRDVFALATKGGFNMIVAAKGQSFETLGAGPHPCVARNIADQKFKGITWTNLNKSDYVDFEAYEHLLPKYTAITDAIRRQHGDE